jgi:hypothetical protein
MVHSVAINILKRGKQLRKVETRQFLTVQNNVAPITQSRMLSNTVPLHLPISLHSTFLTIIGAESIQSQDVGMVTDSLAKVVFPLKPVVVCKGFYHMFRGSFGAQTNVLSLGCLRNLKCFSW